MAYLPFGTGVGCHDDQTFPPLRPVLGDDNFRRLDNERDLERRGQET